ncbi:MAG: hypothetical protein AAFP90_15480, partial [Planctomycetota bacterium]
MNNTSRTIAWWVAEHGDPPAEILEDWTQQWVELAIDLSRHGRHLPASDLSMYEVVDHGLIEPIPSLWETISNQQPSQIPEQSDAGTAALRADTRRVIVSLRRELLPESSPRESIDSIPWDTFLNWVRHPAAQPEQTQSPAASSVEVTQRSSKTTSDNVSDADASQRKSTGLMGSVATWGSLVAAVGAIGAIVWFSSPSPPDSQSNGNGTRLAAGGRSTNAFDMDSIPGSAPDADGSESPETLPGEADDDAAQPLLMATDLSLVPNEPISDSTDLLDDGPSLDMMIDATSFQDQSSDSREGNQDVDDPNLRNSDADDSLDSESDRSPMPDPMETEIVDQQSGRALVAIDPNAASLSGGASPQMEEDAGTIVRTVTDVDGVANLSEIDPLKFRFDATSTRYRFPLESVPSLEGGDNTDIIAGSLDTRLPDQFSLKWEKPIRQRPMRKISGVATLTSEEEEFAAVQLQFDGNINRVFSLRL